MVNEGVWGRSEFIIHASLQAGQHWSITFTTTIGKLGARLCEVVGRGLPARIPAAASDTPLQGALS